MDDGGTFLTGESGVASDVLSISRISPNVAHHQAYRIDYIDGLEYCFGSMTAGSEINMGIREGRSRTIGLIIALIPLGPSFLLTRPESVNLEWRGTVGSVS
jgi:hypothetical protein